jgi:hypothetical protein
MMTQIESITKSLSLEHLSCRRNNRKRDFQRVVVGSGSNVASLLASVAFPPQECAEYSIAEWTKLIDSIGAILSSACEADLCRLRSVLYLFRELHPWILWRLEIKPGSRVRLV